MHPTNLIAISKGNLQFLFLLGLVLAVWLFIRFVAPRVLDWLTPESEKRERAELVAKVEALQALSMEEARERMEKEVFFAGNPEVTWTERAGGGPVCAFALPAAAEEIFSRFEWIRFGEGDAEISRERLQRLEEDWIAIGECEEMGTLVVRTSTGKVYLGWPGEARRAEKSNFYAASLYHAILLLGIHG